jgi:2-dehydro-3-deoxyphosphooctonate aldolase (KDO 8-P synthase)
MKVSKTLSSIPNLDYINEANFFLMAGPCAIEGESSALSIAEKVQEISNILKIPLIFKGSYKKANRSRLDSFTGIGDKKALKILDKIRTEFKLPVITDIHSAIEAEMAAPYVDILQIPAFLSRQTEILVSAAKTGKVVNIKKGQFMAPGAMKFAAQKIIDSGNTKIIITDRGSMFGYQDLVVDFRGLVEMREFGHPVVLDITHSLQKPNQDTGITGGNPHMIETIARAGVAVGVDGLFVETHPDPGSALSDGANMLPLDLMENLLTRLVAIRKTILDF